MTQQTTVLPRDPARPQKRRRPAWVRVVLWLVLPVVLIVALLVIADAAFRSYVEQRVSDTIEKSVPPEVHGRVTTYIGGFSALQQYLAGSFQRVEIDAPSLIVKGVPVSGSVVATGVPADFSKPIAHAQGKVEISQGSLNRLVKIPGATGDITLGAGTLGYDGRLDLLGLPVGYTVTAEPKAAGSQVLLEPKKAALKTGSGDVNLTRLLQALTSQGPFPVCAAQYLPAGVGVDDITVTPGHASVVLSASDFVLGDKFLQSKGSCS